MRALRIVLISLLVAPAAAGMLLLYLRPWHPHSWDAWLLCVILALPILVASEWVEGNLLTHPLSRSVDRATAQSAFSWLRIAYVLGVVILVLGVVAVVMHLWSG
jgi:hypothetical protein